MNAAAIDVRVVEHWSCTSIWMTGASRSGVAHYATFMKQFLGHATLY